MNMKDLYPFVFLMLMVGMLLGVGILAMDAFGNAVKTSTNVVNESVAIAGQAGSSANDDVTAWSYFGNSSINCVAPNPICVNVSSGGAVRTNSSFANATYQLSYTYDADSVGTTALSNVVTAVAPIASTWLPLIVTVAVLAIILGIVVTSFAGRRR